MFALLVILALVLIIAVLWWAVRTHRSVNDLKARAGVLETLWQDLKGKFEQTNNPSNPATAPPVADPKT